MNLKTRVVQLGVLPDGGLGLVYSDGHPIAPQTPLPGMTAGKLNELLLGWIDNALRIGRAVGVEEGAQAVAGPQYAAGVKAGAEAMAEPAMRSGAEAGVKAGMKHAYATSVVRRRIVRDEQGQITGVVEERVPSP